MVHGLRVVQEETWGGRRLTDGALVCWWFHNLLYQTIILWLVHCNYVLHFRKRAFFLLIWKEIKREITRQLLRHREQKSFPNVKKKKKVCDAAAVQTQPFEPGLHAAMCHLSKISLYVFFLNPDNNNNTNKSFCVYSPLISICIDTLCDRLSRVMRLTWALSLH